MLSRDIGRDSLCSWHPLNGWETLACNPLISALALYLIYSITLKISDDRSTAGWSLLFAVSSSAFIAYGASFYSMQAHLAANLLFASLLFKVTPKRAFAAGLVGSLALLLHNPMPHALFAAPWLVALARDPATGPA